MYCNTISNLDFYHLLILFVYLKKRCILDFHKQVSIKISLTSSGRTVSTSNKNDIWCGFPPNLHK